MPSYYCFTDEKYIMSDQDLKLALSNCALCYQLTHEGKLIMFHKNLSNIKLNFVKQHKCIIFVNTTSTGIGHWFLLVFFKTAKKCLLIDSLNHIQYDIDTMKSVQEFCKNNYVKLINFNHKHQTKSSNICGPLSLYMASKASRLSLPGMLMLKQTFDNVSIKNLELFMFKSALKHYNLSFH